MRVAVGLGMFIVALIGLYTFDAVPFKVLYGLFSLMAGVEIVGFLKKRATPMMLALAGLEMVFLVGGVAFVVRTNPMLFWYVILGVPGYDIFAYLFGKLFGGKVFGKARPFPKISANKTWEGTILGLLMSIGMVVMLMAVRGTFTTDWMYLLCGPLALAGDLFESYLKRKFRVKDSGEVILKSAALARFEGLVGGKAGHGGFLDRIDSTAFATTVLFVINLMVGA